MFNPVSSNVPGRLNFGDHVPIHTDGVKRKTCIHCKMNKNKTKSGWKVQTTFQCKVCQVPLCSVERACFELYHRHVLGMDPDMPDS